MDDNYDDKIRKGQVFAADDDAIVGFIVLVPKADHMLLENVAVDPYHQGIGVGRSLLDYAEIHAAQFGFSEVRLYTNEAMTENLSFYPRLGYHETDRRIENDFHRVYYSKRLGLLNPSS
jgi:ribosomal protein S18 acetylase RimI-like enzyme